MRPRHSGVQPLSACSNCVYGNKLTNRWEAAQTQPTCQHGFMRILVLWAVQLTEQDRAPPVNINYLVNTRGGEGGTQIGKGSYIQRMCFNVRCRSARNRMRRMLMPGGAEGEEQGGFKR